MHCWRGFSYDIHIVSRFEGYFNKPCPPISDRDSTNQNQTHLQVLQQFPAGEGMLVTLGDAKIRKFWGLNLLKKGATLIGWWDNFWTSNSWISWNINLNRMVATQIVFLMFTPIFGEDEPNLTSIFFQRGWLKPPTRILCFVEVADLKSVFFLRFPMNQYGLVVLLSVGFANPYES